MIAKYLDCSTGMLTSATFQALTGLGYQRRHWPTMTIATYRDGVFFTVPPLGLEDIAEQVAALPEDLRGLLQHAAAQGCYLVRLDVDGDELVGLPFYDW